MATLIENANRIKNAKESLRQSFVNKGVNISSNSKLEDYAPIVDNLEVLSDSTVLKPYSCFVELKDYYVKDGTTVTKKTVDKEKNRFTNFFKEQGSTSGTKSKEYYDNYYAFFNGYYLEYGSNNAGTTTTIDTYKYTFSEPDVNGIQYRSSRTYVKSSDNFQSQTSTMWSKAAIVKLSDDVGLLSYCRYNYDTYVPDIWYARLFRVATDGTVTLYTAVTTATASSTTTFKTPFFAMSLRGPNFVFVLKEHDNQNTGVKTYYYHQYSCNLRSVSINMVRASNSDGTANADDQKMDNDNNYVFNNNGTLYGNYDYKYLPTNGLAIFSRRKYSDNTIDMRVYFGDNRANAWSSGAVTFTNNMFPLAFPIGKATPCIFYKTGTWHPEVAGSSTEVTKNITGYIKGKNKDGFLIGSYSIEGTTIQNKEYLIDYDHTNNIFKPIKEL